MSLALHQDMLVVDVFDDEFVVVLGVDAHDDGFDGGVALDKDTWAEVTHRARHECNTSHTSLCARHLGDRLV